MSDPLAWGFTVGGEFTERLDHLTDILSAATGPEQRNRLRDTPHVQIGFRGIAEGDERRRLDQQLHANGAGQWWVPWLPEGQALGAALDSGATWIGIDTRWRHFVAGGHALLVRGDESEVVAIDSLSDTALTLSDATTSAWPKGTMVYPAMLGRLETMVDLPRFTGDAGSYVARFRNDAPVSWTASAGATLYRSLPVMDIPVEWTVDPVDVPERDLAQVGNEMSLPFVYDPVGQPRNSVKQSVTVEGLEQIAALRSLCYALAGCWSVIWVPSRAQDLRVVATVADGATSMDVAAIGLADATLVDNRRDIRVVLRDGTALYRRITAVTAPSAGVERLALDSAIAAGFGVGDVAQVAFLQLCRQESDSNLLRYWKHDVASTLLEFRGEAHHGL